VIRRNDNNEWFLHEWSPLILAFTRKCNEWWKVNKRRPLSRNNSKQRSVCVCVEGSVCVCVMNSVCVVVVVCEHAVCGV